MSETAVASRQCPHHHAVSQRKSDQVAKQGGTVAVRRMIGTDFSEARRILRDPSARQAGFLAELVTRFALMRAPILYLSGAEHRRQRGATARFFAPRVVTSSYRALMTETSARLIDRLQADRRADLDQLSLKLAVTIASEIVGLTNSDRAAMARRLDALAAGMRGEGSAVGKAIDFVRGQVRALLLLYRDVKPAIRARRRTRRDDVISHLLDEGYRDMEILSECLTYGAAGMITTREFITMAGWHLLEQPELRQRFLDTNEAGRIAILEEILRLEPVVGLLHRTIGDTEETVGIDVRAANADGQAFGACPHRIDPDRALGDRVGRAGMAFGDGEHRCPGAQVALLESAIFLDQLLRVPGLRMMAEPAMGWNALIAGYELRGLKLACGDAA